MNVSLIVASVGRDRKEGWQTLDEAMLALGLLPPDLPDAFTWHDPLGDNIHVARNEAAATAKGHWLLFVGPGDRLVPGYLEAMELAERHLPVRTEPDYDRALLIPHVSYWPAHAGNTTEQTIPRPPDLDRFADANVCPLGTLVPRRLFTALGGFDPAAADPDHDLWLRCHGAGASLLPVPAAVYITRHREFV